MPCEVQVKLRVDDGLVANDEMGCIWNLCERRMGTDGDCSGRGILVMLLIALIHGA